MTNWFPFHGNYFFKKEEIKTLHIRIIVYTEFQEMAIVSWLDDGWNGPQWYSADEEHYYKEEHILYFMEAPFPPKKSIENMVQN